MYILYLSQKMRNIYKLKLSESIPDEKENQFPLIDSGFSLFPILLTKKFVHLS